MEKGGRDLFFILFLLKVKGKSFNKLSQSNDIGKTWLSTWGKKITQHKRVAKEVSGFMTSLPESTQLKTLRNTREKSLSQNLSPEDTQILFELTAACELWSLGFFLCHTADWIKPDSNTCNIWKYVGSEVHFTAFVSHWFIRSYSLDFLLLLSFICKYS